MSRSTTRLLTVAGTFEGHGEGDQQASCKEYGVNH